MPSVFVTMPSLRLPCLVASIRAFGGPLARAPVWAFGDTQDIPGIEFFPLDVPDTVKGFPFAGKVAACAAAEELAAGKFDSLIWIDPECLVVNPPVLYRLAKPFGAALRPVHVRNVGMPLGKPDAFWALIFEIAGEPDFPVETFVDGQSVGAYFNTHAFSVDPGLGLMRRWARVFGGLIEDDVFQSESGLDDLHKVFLHQAVLSALAGSEIGSGGIRILPPTYNYPYNLQGGIPEARRAQRMNDLVTVACEGRSLDPAGMDDICVKEPLRTWLSSFL